MTAKAGLRTALESGHPPRRATSAVVHHRRARSTARRDRAREPFARNRLQLPAGAARRDHIVGTRGVSHFFWKFFEFEKEAPRRTKLASPASQQPHPPTQPIRQTMHRRSRRDTVEPLNPPVAAQNPKIRKTGHSRTKRRHEATTHRPRTLPRPNPSRPRLFKKTKKIKKLPKNRA